MVAMSTEIRSINTPWAAAGFFFGVVFCSLYLPCCAIFFFVNLLYYCCDGRFQPRILILYLSCVDRSHSSPFEDSTTQFTMFKELRLYSFGSLIIEENESDFFTLSLTISPHIFESDLKKTLLKFKISLQ